ncbi:MAG TPA: hypothetical protein VHY08_12550 [Bacillota bacterium]|nr:hypothetical protein [Bacillota bacterium]
MGNETFVEFDNKIATVANKISEYKLIKDQTIGIGTTPRLKTSRDWGSVIHILTKIIKEIIRENRKLAFKEELIRKKYQAGAKRQQRQSSRRQSQRPAGRLFSIMNRWIGNIRQLLRWRR